jgi:hypothetical protein
MVKQGTQSLFLSIQLTLPEQKKISGKWAQDFQQDS